MSRWLRGFGVQPGVREHVEVHARTQVTLALPLSHTLTKLEALIRCPSRGDSANKSQLQLHTLLIKLKSVVH